LALKSSLKKDHARDCLKYAVDSMQTDPGDIPMVFPAEELAKAWINSQECVTLIAKLSAKHAK